MKVSSVKLSNFKKFENLYIDFREAGTDRAKDLIVLVGNNGTGKSTLLQAIAATVGTATNRLREPSQLDWPGFQLEYIGDSWRRAPLAEIDISLTDDEIAATREYFDRSHYAGNSNSVPPTNNKIVSLRYEPTRGHRVEAIGGAESYFQLRGHAYARTIVKEAKESFDVFKRVGAIFYYHEYRNSLSLSLDDGQKYNENQLRGLLGAWENKHRRPKKDNDVRNGIGDLYAQVEAMYSRVFPNRRFVGSTPHPDPSKTLNDSLFLLSDGVHQYEISEMSGGERAIFAMILDFARLNIHNSIILIDEIELHLHPPLQQALVYALSKMGDNNQFIITTHSESLAPIIPSSSVYRMEELGG